MIKRSGMLLSLGIAVLLSAQLVLPITISHATSGSMAPVIDEGDAYLVHESDTVEVGDVITFYSAAHDEHVTHRVVGRTSDGLVTRGDANARTDQDAGTPPVHPSSVLGTVVTFGGQPLTVPGAGAVIATVQDRNLWIAAGLLVVLLADVILDRGTSRPDRRLLRVRDVANVLLLGAFVWCLAAVAFSGAEHQYTYVVSTEETSADHTVLRGQTSTRTIALSQRLTPLTTTVLETSGAELVDQRTEGTERSVTIRPPVRESIGAYTATVRVRTYPNTLPRELVRSIQRVHWILAGIATLLPVFVPLTAAYWLCFDGMTPVRAGAVRRSVGPGGDLR